MRKRITDLNLLGKTFRRYRQQKHLTEKEVAESTGISNPRRLILYEEGRLPIPLNHIYAISRRLDVPGNLVMKITQDYAAAIKVLPHRPY